MNYRAPLVSQKGQSCENAKVFALVNHSSEPEGTKRSLQAQNQPGSPDSSLREMVVFLVVVLTW